MRLSRRDDLQQLAAFSRQFPTLEEFLTQMALLTSVEAEEDEAKKSPDEEALRLSTIHQAKGLEFDVVFVIMMCDGLFPSSRSLDNPDNLEEERRLFYVAVTRAKEELYLTHPLFRAAARGALDQPQQPSRFLSEIPKTLLDDWSLTPPSGFH